MTGVSACSSDSWKGDRAEFGYRQSAYRRGSQAARYRVGDSPNCLRLWFLHVAILRCVSRVHRTYSSVWRIQEVLPLWPINPLELMDLLWQLEPTVSSGVVHV